MEVNLEKHLRIMAKTLFKSANNGSRTNIEKGYYFKNEGKSGGRTQKWDIDIDEEYIFQLLKQTNGTCIQTGYKFPLVNNSNHYTMNASRDLGFNSLFSPSIDRIDPKLGYIKGNIQIVVRWYNWAKNKHSQKEMDEVMRMLKNPPKEHIIYESKKETKTNNINLKETKMKTTTEIELIKTLIDNDASQHALKFFTQIQTQFSNKVEVTINEVKGTEYENLVRLYGKPYADRRINVQNNSTEISYFESNYISLKELFDVKDTHAVFASSRLDEVINKGIEIVRVKAKRGWIYGIDRENVSKLKL